MRFTIASTLVAVAIPLVSGQTTHNITVGQNGLTFEPSNITASAGDTVSFTFYAKNHTATQSTFAAPCTQLVNTTGSNTIVGISSGYMPVGANATSNPVWSIAVQDTTPLWFFCLQANHCQQGMVFSINATPAKSHEAFLAAAKATTNSTAAPQTGGAQTPAGSSGSGGSSGSPVVASGTTSASPNGNPSSTTTGGATTSSTGAASRLGSSGATPILVSALAFVFGVVL